MGMGGADPASGPREERKDAGLVVPHQVERHVGLEAPESAEEAPELAHPLAGDFPPLPQADHQQLVEVRMPGEHRGHPLLDHPGDLRLWKVPPQGREHRQGVDHVPQCAGADDEDPHHPGPLLPSPPLPPSPGEEGEVRRFCLGWGFPLSL
jgi:hypothetical protein